MVKTNDVLDGPLTGEEFRYFGDKFRILQSSRSTQDVSLRVDYFAAPGANVLEHVHHHHEERIEVISGTLGLRIEGRRLTLGPGESAIGPPGIPHAWWNPSDDEKAHFLAEIRPGLDVEIMLETVRGLARDGKTIGETIPRNPLQLAVLAREFGSWGYFTGVPRPVRWALFAPVRVLAFVGELLGYRVSYPEYSGPEVAQTMRLPPETDRPLTLVSALWLLNSAIGARVAIREDLPAEWVAGLYAGSDASAEFFKGGGTALSPGLPMMAAQALFTVLSARRYDREDRSCGAGLAGLGRHHRDVGRNDNLQGPLAQDVRPRQGVDRLGCRGPLSVDGHPRCEAAQRSEERALRDNGPFEPDALGCRGSDGGVRVVFRCGPRRRWHVQRAAGSSHPRYGSVVGRVDGFSRGFHWHGVLGGSGPRPSHSDSGLDRPW